MKQKLFVLCILTLLICDLLAMAQPPAAAPALSLTPGSRTSFKVEASTDPLTGRSVRRITPPGYEGYLPYYTREVITQDNRGILISIKVGEDWYPFISYPDEGAVVCVSDVPLFNLYNPAIGGDRVIYVDKKMRLGWAPVSGGPFNATNQIPGDAVSEVAPSKDGRFCTLFYFLGKERETVKNLLKGDYPSRVSEGTVLPPAFCMVYIDLDNGVSKGILGSVADSVAHPMISPADPNWIEYCDAGSWRRVVRMRSLHYFPDQLGYAEKSIPYDQKVNQEGVGHEFYLQDGRLAAIWMDYDKPALPDKAPSKTGILIVDQATKQFEIFQSPGMVWNHLHGRDGKVFVSEGASAFQCTEEQRKKIPAPGPEGMGRGDLLSLYRVKDGKLEATPLCIGGFSWKGQAGHAHAVIARDNSYAVFNRDQGGHSAVYQVAAN